MKHKVIRSLKGESIAGISIFGNLPGERIFSPANRRIAPERKPKWEQKTLRACVI